MPYKHVKDMTPEELERARKRGRERYASLTEEQKKKLSRYAAEHKRNLPPEKKAEYNRKQYERRKNMSAEEKRKYLEKSYECRRRWYASLSKERKIEMHRKEAQRKREWRERLTEDELKAYRAKQNEADRRRWHALPEEQRRAKSRRDWEHRKAKLGNETASKKKFEVKRERYERFEMEADAIRKAGYDTKNMTQKQIARIYRLMKDGGIVRLSNDRFIRGLDIGKVNEYMKVINRWAEL